MIATQNSDVIENVKELASDRSNNLKIVKTVSDFSDVIKNIISYEVDLVYISMDIDYCGGLEAIKRIKKKSLSCHVVVVSDYGNYDLVREAFLLGADDVIISDADISAYEKSLNKISMKIIQERKKAELEKKNEDINNHLFWMAKNSFAYSLLFKGKKYSKLDVVKDVFDFEDRGYVINIEFDSVEKLRDSQERQMIDLLENHILKDEKAMVGPVLFNRIVLIVSEDGKSRKKSIEKSEKLGVKISNILYEEVGMSVYIGIGGLYKLDDITKSYEESIKALRYYEREKIIKYDDISLLDKSIEWDRINELIVKIEESISHDGTEAIKLFSEIIHEFEILNEISKKNKIYELIVHFICCVSKIEPSACDFVNLIGMAQEFEKIDSTEIDAWAINRMQYILKCLKDTKRERVPESIRFVKNYIYDNYTKEITLSEMADMIGVTSQYLSKLFKEETGYNFTTWINTIRINKAREIMDKGNVNVGEIAYLVGYNDSNYFSRAFKKYTQMTPSQYINKKQKK